MQVFHATPRAARLAAFAILLALGIGISFSDATYADDAPDRLRDLRVVSSALALQGECLGIACTPSPYYAAYARIVSSSDLSLDAMLDAYDRALPAGRIYLGAAILKKDHVRGESLLRDLAKSWMPLSKQYGCIGEITTVGSAARFVLANGGLPNHW